ncbi:uncharacterized protein E0L32_002946 [Thyridium curvatum]|uniref:Cellobiose dehydrogenase-like cytochrome domain-containing protein n=1 Tax=Thyridium curvatum TaxID=1093900 RepID=A0A507B407_9PEZI|nr:uncharacterized protein E0L32_002946 [Thyridium curvatum]TPX17845.1 hypothetical protein E0L32_002946 [Thyridium curvatum]
MPPTVRLTSLIAVTIALSSALCLAQDKLMTQGTYIDPDSALRFTSWSSTPDADGRGAFTFGMTLLDDAADKNATDYVGVLIDTTDRKGENKKQKCQSLSANQTGWCGLAHGGSMLRNLLLMAWPHEGRVLTSFRWATDYFKPGVYGGNATLTQVTSRVDPRGFEVMYRCGDCLRWSEGADEGSAGTSAGSLMLGWAQGADGPTDAASPEGIDFIFHNNGYGTWRAELEGEVNPSS